MFLLGRQAHPEITQHLDTQNLFGRMLSIQKHPKPPVQPQASLALRPLSMEHYAFAQPPAEVRNLLHKDNNNNVFFESAAGKVFITRLDPHDVLYKVNTSLVERHTVSSLQKPQNIMLLQTEKPHEFRLFNSDGTQGSRMYVYPRQDFFPDIETPAWMPVDEALYQKLLSLNPELSQHGEMKLPQPSIAFLKPLKKPAKPMPPIEKNPVYSLSHIPLRPRLTQTFKPHSSSPLTSIPENAVSASPSFSSK